MTAAPSTRRPVTPGPSPKRILLPLAFVGTLALLALPSLAAAFSGPAYTEEDMAVACSDCHEADEEAFAGSIHGDMECTDCHSGSEVIPHEEIPTAPACADCHDEISSQYAASAHGVAWENGEHEAAACADCHGDFHGIVSSSDEASLVHPTKLAGTCGRCHADPELVERHGIPVARPMEAYEDSVHARAVLAGEHGATCSACHGSHELYRASNPHSTVNHLNVAETCSQCHGEIAEVYKTSAHGEAAAHGIREAPVCTDCHGEHRILAPSEPGSPVYVTNIPKMTCGRCHGDLRLADKYGIEPDKVAAYEDSYHGLASRSGKVTVAHCGSCHGVHGVLPSSDPASPVHADNLSATCGQCHPGAGTRFAIGDVHVLPTEVEHAAVYWVRQIYIMLIVVTIGGMLLHNGFDLYRKTRMPAAPASAVGAEGKVRMMAGFRLAHVLMMVSFGLLVYTGFALTYPESWWASPVLLWEKSFGLRGWLHRGAAIVMLASLAVHAAHLMVSRPARRCIAKMRPSLHDVTEAREKLMWFIGRRSAPPPSPDLGYAEKMEYIALMWGILVMAVTGFVLWFDNVALAWLPKWIIDVATVVHFYEAILATLAIVVWHFYFVIFDPVVYPMDTAWLTGRGHPGRELERRAALPQAPPRKKGDAPPQPPVKVTRDAPATPRAGEGEEEREKQTV